MSTKTVIVVAALTLATGLYARSAVRDAKTHLTPEALCQTAAYRVQARDQQDLERQRSYDAVAYQATTEHAERVLQASLARCMADPTYRSDVDGDLL